jgi:predicted GH43/DUF377 family glycosyl hydrolase
MIKLNRITDQPILTPKPDNSWEAGAVFNCAAIYKDDLVHLIYRATDITSAGAKAKYINNLGYAVSANGIHFNRLEKPILENDVEQEARGPEDPRVVKIDGVYQMLYTGFGGRYPGDYRICRASSMNLISWQRHGIVLNESNKDASLFPEKINGKYVLLHRRPPDIWMATSPDLKKWGEHKILMKALPGSDWECEKIGISGPPIKTESGWVLIYHGVNSRFEYRLGIALIDLDNPGSIIARQRRPILEPQLEWEVNGHVPMVVFSCGQVVIDGMIFVYYGAADTVIGVAKIKLEDIKFA